MIDAYAAQRIQLEIIANDLDYLDFNRLFTYSPSHYPRDQGLAFLDQLHAAGQYWFPILDPNVYAPDPTNASDAYAPYAEGEALSAYIRNGEDTYFGVLWAGISAYMDFLVPGGQQFWTDQFVRYQKVLPYDGWWLDVSDATSFCTYSFSPDQVALNPIHVPFDLPGDPDSAVAVDYHYPEQFAVTNASEAASASAKLASQSAAYPTPPTPTPTYQRTQPTPGVRQLNFPPYAIKNDAVPGNSLVKQVLAPNATHNDGSYNSTEYDLHNIYGHLGARASFNAMKEAKPGLRPFILARSQFAGSGVYGGHWGGDTASSWGNMYFGITQALQNAIAGVAYFGVETCGFRGNSDYLLCTRWMQLSAWFPLYRNHNSRNTIAQEPYRWATTAEGTRRIMNIRYSLLPYTYTLFYKANTAGETVLRALAWEFPNDESLKAVETQFMSGPAILVTPVLEALATSVRGVFSGVAEGTIWYDWYTLQKVDVAPGENKTLDAPLVYQPIHVRGGYIVPIQAAGNTTATSRKMPGSLLIALDKNQEASGELYLDDGVSLEPQATKYVEVSDRVRQNRHELAADLNRSFLLRKAHSLHT